jgi:hypothetical protein
MAYGTVSGGRAHLLDTAVAGRRRGQRTATDLPGDPLQVRGERAPGDAV